MAKERLWMRNSGALTVWALGSGAERSSRFLVWGESRVPKAASGHISQTSTSKSEIPKDTTLSKGRESSPAVLGPQRIPSDMKTNKAEITLHKTPLIHLKGSGTGLHIPDSQALQAPGMLKILHFASIYKAYLEAIDHSQKPKLSASLICSLSLSSWKTLCAHLTILQAQSGYSSHLKKGDSVPWPQWKHLKEQGWMSASPKCTP